MEVLISNTWGKQIVNVHASSAAETLHLSVHRGLLFVSPGSQARTAGSAVLAVKHWQFEGAFLIMTEFHSYASILSE